MKTIKRYIRLYKVLVSQFLKSIMQSKIDFLMGLFGFFFTQLAGIAFLYLVFEQIPSLQGWTLNELIFVYGFAQIPRGIDHLFTDSIWLIAWRYVVTGEFDRFLLRPMNTYFQIISEKLQPDALGEILIGTILICQSIKNNIVSLHGIYIILFIVSIIAGSFIYTGIKLLYASLSFWVKRSGPILQMAYELSNFAKYPTTIYSKSIQFVLTWIVPFSFVAYYPATVFLKNGQVEIILIECVIAIMVNICAHALFYKGISIYESAGN